MDEFKKAVQDLCVGKKYEAFPPCFKNVITKLFRTIDINGRWSCWCQFSQVTDPNHWNKLEVLRLLLLLLLLLLSLLKLLLPLLHCNSPTVPLAWTAGLSKVVHPVNKKKKKKLGSNCLVKTWTSYMWMANTQSSILCCLITHFSPVSVTSRQ